MMFKDIYSEDDKNRLLRTEVRYYDGYNKAARRSEVKLLGSFKPGDFEATDLLEKLDAFDDIEKRGKLRGELLYELHTRKQAHDKHLLQSAVIDATQYVNLAADSIKQGITTDAAQLQALDEALGRLRRVMANVKRRGKPVRDKSEVKTSEPEQITKNPAEVLTSGNID